MLDESAIEAMIARQREAMDNHEVAPSVRTVQTDEFEVYERQSKPKTPEPAPPPPTRPAAAKAEHEDEFEVFERKPAPTAAPAVESAPITPVAEPAAEPQPEPTPAPATPTPTPAPTPAPSPAPTQPFAPQPTRRPEVWPPLGARAAPATAPAASTSAAAATPAPAAPTPSAPVHEPPVTPRSHAPAAHEPAGAPAPTHHAFPDLSHSAPAPGGNGPRIAIVQALFNEEITNDMANLARQKADKLGAPVALHLKVPGVYDLPLAVQALLRRDDIDCVVALGCVVSGETKHDEVITHATAKSLQDVSLATGKPVGFGVIGPGMTWKQAEARVVNGKHAVEAAVAQWHILRNLTT